MTGLLLLLLSVIFLFFFFNDTATTEIYTLSLHDALPIYRHVAVALDVFAANVKITLFGNGQDLVGRARDRDRKSTRLNSSHGYISYAVFCLKKKKNKYTHLLSGQAHPTVLT